MKALSTGHIAAGNGPGRATPAFVRIKRLPDAADERLFDHPVRKTGLTVRDLAEDLRAGLIASMTAKRAHRLSQKM